MNPEVKKYLGDCEGMNLDERKTEILKRIHNLHLNSKEPLPAFVQLKTYENKISIPQIAGSYVTLTGKGYDTKYEFLTFSPDAQIGVDELTALEKAIPIFDHNKKAEEAVDYSPLLKEILKKSVQMKGILTFFLIIFIISIIVSIIAGLLSL